jgi:hypothetical protein
MFGHGQGHVDVRAYDHLSLLCRASGFVLENGRACPAPWLRLRRVRLGRALGEKTRYVCEQNMSGNDNGRIDVLDTHAKESKRSFEELLCHHGQVFVALDGSAPGVVLPEHLRSGQVMLDYNLNAAIPIPDLEATEEGIRATLSFSREPFATFVPWSAVIGMAAKERAQEAPKKPKLTLV